MLFPPAFLDRLRGQITLSALIGGYIPLKRHGREHTGLCPFHSEKSPSFTVNDAKGFYHCFGCAAHGDAFDFVQRYEKLSWRESVEKLARQAGMALPEASPQERAREEAHTGLLQAMEAAARWFEQNLLRTEHHAARAYVTQRGLRADTVKQFRIGFAPDARDALKRHLLAAGFPEALQAQAGLIIIPENGAGYDRFRARLMFPIRDARGRVIAFGGRLMAQAHNAPKYLNSPETPLFHKGEVLFNFDQASKAAREKSEIVIVEGYMDAIMMAQAGFAHTVATLGTAVTEAHLRMLWRIAQHPVLCLDGDAAGLRASARAATLALPLCTPEHGLRFAFLPAGEDPDSLLRKDGDTALRTVLNQAEGLAETLWRQESAHTGKTPEARAALESRLMTLAASAGHPLLAGQYKQYFRSQLWQQQKKTPPPARFSLSAPRPQIAPQALALALAAPQLLHDARIEHYISQLHCTDAALERLRCALLELLHTQDDLHGCKEQLEAQGHAQSIATLPQQPADETATRLAWQGLLHAENMAALEAEHAALQHQALDDESFTRLLHVQSELKELRTKMYSDA